ncbi:hypothetical protein CHUAL_005197 [Chamberlinius hualienensis]
MDTINVVIRIRPLLPSEKSLIQWEVQNNEIYSTEEIKRSNYTPYTFNKVFGIDKTTESLFDEVGRPTLQAVMQGYNGTIFAYGPTFSGKTFTMMGSATKPGLIPRMVKSIFDFIENTPERAYMLRVSYTEIYCEAVYDLLSCERKPLAIREDASGQTFAENLKQEVVSSVADIMKLMRLGEKNRTFGATVMNPNSSRSHAIFSIIIESGKLSDQEGDSEVLASGDLASDVDIMVSQLNLVDLAGSERTGLMNIAAGKFRESSKINTSLFTLRKVMSQLSENDGSFVNFRDSKLTRILQPSLGGNAKTTIICTVNPSVLEETHSTLKFASMAKRIKSAPVKNVVISADTLLKQYATEIEDLQRQLQKKEKVDFDQEKMKQQLEETSLRNKELEDRLKTIKESVITSSALVRVGQRLRRETWGGFHGFEVPTFDFAPSTPLKQSQQDFQIFRSISSVRLLPPLFVEDNVSLGNNLPKVKEFSCQVEFLSESERKLKRKYNVLKAQSTFESETHFSREKELEEQMDFAREEQVVLESENKELKQEICELKQQIEEFQGLLPLKNPKLATLKNELNDSSLNGSLGIISEDERAKGFILPWTENELMDKLSNLEQESIKYLERATLAEAALLKLQESSTQYRAKMEKTIDDFNVEHCDMKQSLLKLQSELESVFLKNYNDKQKWKIILADAEAKIIEDDRRCKELENETEKLKQQLRQTECKEKEHLETISQLQSEMYIESEEEIEFSELEEQTNKEPVLKEEIKYTPYEERIIDVEKPKDKTDMTKLEPDQNCQQCNDKNEELQQIKDDYNAKINELMEQKLKMEEILQRYSEAENSLDELQQRLNVYHTKELDLKEMIDNLNSRCDEMESLEKVAQERKLEVDNLTKELKSLEEITKENRHLKLEIEEYRKQLNRTIEVNRDLNQHLEDIKEKLDNCEQIESLLEKLSFERKTVNDLKEKLVTAKQELEDLSLDSSIKDAKLQQMVEMHDKQLTMLSDEKFEIARSYSLLEKRYNESEMYIADLKRKLNEYEAEESHMKRVIGTLTSSCEELKSWKSVAEQKFEILTKDSSDLKAIEEENNLLKLKISELEEHANKMAAFNVSLNSNFQNEENIVNCAPKANLLEEIAAEKRKVDELQKELETANQNADSNRKRFREKLVSLSNQQVEYQEDKMTYEKRIASLIDENSELEDECNRLKDNIRRLHTSMDSTMMTAGKSNDSGPIYRWDEGLLGGSGAPLKYSCELLKAENEKLKKKLLDGCQRCKHIRSVISSKAKENHRLSRITETVSMNEKRQLYSVKTSENDASPLVKSSFEDQENKINMKVLPEKNEKLVGLNITNTSSPLRPVDAGMNKLTLELNNFSTPKLTGHPRLAVASPWSGILKSHRLQQGKAQSEIQRKDVLLNSNAASQKSDSPLSYGLSKRQFTDEFLSEKDCKVQ